MPRPSGRVIRSRQRDLPAAKDFTISSALSLLSELDTGVSLGVAIQLRYREYGDLVKRGLGETLNPADYLCASDFRKDYLASTLLSKMEFVSIEGINKREVALAKWWECERHCGETNQRLWKEGSMPEPVWLALRRARSKISSLLGAFDPVEADLACGFGRGGTTRLPRREACVANKVWGQLHASSLDLVGTSGSFKEVFALNERLCAAMGKEPSQHVGVELTCWNKVTTVPKSAKTDRPIASEPDLNIWSQKGIGTCIRRRLRRVGIDLSNQRKNRLLAQEGSETGELATLDLSSASDTLSLRLVELLLPDEWLEPLSKTRSQWALLPDGAKHLYRKWSSMGNGYTFELETLIFWALASAVVERVDAQWSRGVSVYGDDVILPSHAYDAVVEVFTYCGFIVNQEKSFSAGPFRESCGGHYFLGEDVTPFYLKTRLDGPHRWFWWVNRIRHWTRREVAGFFYCDQHFRTFYEKQRALFGALCDEKGRELSGYTVPCGMGEDAGFVSNFDEARVWFRRERRNLKLLVFQCLEYEMLCHIRKIRTAHSYGSLAGWLLLADKDTEDELPPTELEPDWDEDPTPFRVNDLPTTSWKYSRKRGHVGQWYDIGPWF